ncbi:TlpA disulfide reductase family protein [Hamadaea sp. NPDC051192]|uniref:TlpA family protein disulfide reductase n=1 Tax=Hamadaea sp. NPDC051192 TaxID=3154940 RepID=UPI003441C4B0
MGLTRRSAVLGVLAAVTLAACSDNQDQKGTQSGLIEAAKRKKAPTVTGDLLEGGRFDLSAYQGKVVVVNFWASWCAPCRAEATDLEEVWQSAKASGVQFVGINIRDEKDKAIAFHSGRATYPSIFDPAGKIALGFSDVPPSAIPSTLVIDQQGRIASITRRDIRAADLREVVEAVVAEKDSPNG